MKRAMPDVAWLFYKAGNQTRTDDPFITSEVLYRLSYSGNPVYTTCHYIRFGEKVQVILFL